MKISQILNAFMHGLGLAVGNFYIMLWIEQNITMALQMQDLMPYFIGMNFVFSCIFFLVGVSYETAEEKPESVK